MKTGPENLFEKDSNEPQNQKTMKTFIGSKLVKAKPMDEHTFLYEIKGKEVEANRENAHGYLVKYPDGYQSWNVKEEFERCSRMLTQEEHMDFIPQCPEGFSVYIQTKIVNAEPMNYGKFFNEQNPDRNISDTEDESGYKVIYPNGHESWSPTVKFEEAYRELTEVEYYSVLNPFNNFMENGSVNQK